MICDDRVVNDDNCHMDSVSKSIQMINGKTFPFPYFGMRYF